MNASRENQMQWDYTWAVSPGKEWWTLTNSCSSVVPLLWHTGHGSCKAKTTSYLLCQNFPGRKDTEYVMCLALGSYLSSLLKVMREQNPLS